MDVAVSVLVKLVIDMYVSASLIEKLFAPLFIHKILFVLFLQLISLMFLLPMLLHLTYGELLSLRSLLILISKSK